nr:MAG TPA: peptidoglycan hydrolase [Caudoviricetes sp.]
MQGTKTGTSKYPFSKLKKGAKLGIILFLVLSLTLYTFLYTISDYKNMPYFVYKFIYVITQRERRNEIMLLDTDKQKFVDDIAKYVQKYAGSYGISVHSPIIAQAILESGWGKSRLATDYHNYFGMKCGTKWTGPSVNMTTQEEYTAGTLATIKDNFRVYDNMENGVKGYFEFIQLSRYENLKGIVNPQKYIETIKNDGYATSSTYVDSLMQIIKIYNLTSYDSTESVEGEDIMGSRQAMIAKMQSWIGKNEVDGSFREIIDIYNSHTPRARGYKLQYSDEWCAGTVSAAAIATGNTNAVPLEVSCHYMIEGAKAKGIWVENDSYVPQGGDIILYDWQDSGIGDNTGNPDHVGVVEYTSGGIIHVIEGNNGEKVARRELSVNGRYIRGFIVPKYSDNVAPSGGVTPTVSGTIDELARRVIAGEFGSGDARKNVLGDKYDAVQARVNEILSGTASTPSKSVSEVAKEVLAGSWGNGSDRKAKLEAAGYNYDEVQSAVNALCNKPTLKSVSEIAKEVLAGKWGNGTDRKNKLTAAGYNYNEVQAAVNSLNKKSVTTIAKEVIAGKWGNGSDRKKKLESAGYNYNEVQKEVNRLL